MRSKLKGQTQLLDLEGEAARTALLESTGGRHILNGRLGGARRPFAKCSTRRVSVCSNFPQADAYVRRFHYLSKLELPQGSFDLGENLPPTASPCWLRRPSCWRMPACIPRCPTC